MTKPIVVCGVDFSGTSMVAGMLHAAGIDMGDVESAENVAANDGPIRYRTFQCRELNAKLVHLAELQMINLPEITDPWLDALYEKFIGYLKWREARAGDSVWGVKNNGLVFLAMHEKFDSIPVQWVVTYRDFGDIMQSSIQKIGRNPRFAAILGHEFLAWDILTRPCRHITVLFDDFFINPVEQAQYLASRLDIDWNKVDAMASIVDLKTKGIIPCHGSSPALPF